MNDEKEAQIVSRGIEAVLKDTVIYDLSAYQESFAVAYEVLKNEAGKNQPIKWKDGSDVVLNGEKVHLFQSTEKQYKNAQLFGTIHYPTLIQSPRTGNSLSEIGYANGLDVNASRKYSAELLGNIAEANRNRQDNGKLLRDRYYHYVTAPKGIAEPVIWEDLLVGGTTFKLGSSVISTTEKALSKTGDTLAKAMVSDEALALGVVAESQLNRVLGRVANSTVSYVDNSIKAMEGQGAKVALANGLAAGGVKLGFEANDYLSGNKELTKENILNSTKEVGYSTGLGLATSGMPLTPAVGLSVVGDWVKDGRYDVNKSLGSAVVGGVVESKFGNNALSPALREIGTSTFEKVYERTITGGKDE